MTNTTRITRDQVSYLRTLHQRHHVPDTTFDAWVADRFGCRLHELHRTDASRLIDEVKAWTSVPPDIRRAMGQLDLFGGLL